MDSLVKTSTSKALISKFCKLFYKIESKGDPPNSCYEASFTLIPKLDKNAYTPPTKLQTKFSDGYEKLSIKYKQTTQ